MNQKSQEQMYASLQRGMQASADLSVAGPLLTDRREALIRQAIADYQRKDEHGRRMYEGLDALLFVAALVENARLKDDLEHAERQGRRDGAKLSSM